MYCVNALLLEKTAFARHIKVLALRICWNFPEIFSVRKYVLSVFHKQYDLITEITVKT